MSVLEFTPDLCEHEIDVLLSLAGFRLTTPSPSVVTAASERLKNAGLLDRWASVPTVTPHGRMVARVLQARRVAAKRSLIALVPGVLDYELG